MIRRPVLALGTAAAVLMVGVAVGQATRGSARDDAVPATTSVPVIGATAVCPDLRQAPGQLASRVSAGAAPLLAGGSGSGTLAVAPLTATTPPTQLPITKPGQVASGLGTTVNGDALVVEARGELAAGLEVEQLTRAESGVDRGLAGQRCAAPSTDLWFYGGGTIVGQDATLVLVNADPTDALVDVQVLTYDGPADVRPGRGIVVPGRSRSTIDLSTIAPNRDGLVTHVTATRGRVAAGVLTHRFDGAVPKGVEWAAPAGPPATDQVVPGLPAGPGGRALVVGNPGPASATVQVQLTTGEGQFVPDGLDAVEVPPGRTVPVDLSALLATTPAAVSIRSDQPVVAGAAVFDGGANGVEELALAGPAAALSGPAELTDLTVDRPTESYLLLSAVGDDATITVTAIVPEGGSVPGLAPSKQVVVPGGTTQVLPMSTFLPPASVAAFAVEVRPAVGSGPIYAARYLRTGGATGPLTTILALRSAAQEVQRPPVVTDLTVDRPR